MIITIFSFLVKRKGRNFLEIFYNVSMGKVFSFNKKKGKREKYFSDYSNLYRKYYCNKNFPALSFFFT